MSTVKGMGLQISGRNLLTSVSMGQWSVCLVSNDLFLLILVLKFFKSPKLDAVSEIDSNNTTRWGTSLWAISASKFFEPLFNIYVYFSLFRLW